MNNDSKQLQLVRVQFKDFRCFEQVTIDLDSPIVLICGSNGTGKTSLLEALYYCCYLRSFRTSSARDLIALGKESFFIKLFVHDNSMNDCIEHTISIGFTENKKRVTVDNKSVISYKELLNHYRVISLTEDDLKLIQDGPEERRAFLDQALLLEDAAFISIMRQYRSILENRNALFLQETIDEEVYAIWTKKLWEQTIVIQVMRKQLLEQLEIAVNTMLAQYVDSQLFISCAYQAKKQSDLPFETFLKKNADLMKSEIYFKRSLFGVHIDDFIFTLEGKKSRMYGSRGQQKMILLLIKIAQIKQLTKKNGSMIFLVDDFMTDFDSERGKALLSVLLSLDGQLIFTSPRRDNVLESALINSGLEYKIISM